VLFGLTSCSIFIHLHSSSIIFVHLHLSLLILIHLLFILIQPSLSRLHRDTCFNPHNLNDRCDFGACVPPHSPCLIASTSHIVLHLGHLETSHCPSSHVLPLSPVSPFHLALCSLSASSPSELPQYSTAIPTTTFTTTFTSRLSRPSSSSHNVPAYHPPTCIRLILLHRPYLLFIYFIYLNTLTQYPPHHLHLPSIRLVPDHDRFRSDTPPPLYTTSPLYCHP